MSDDLFYRPKLRFDPAEKEFLTEREKQILICAAYGYNRLQTAKILFISDSTFQYHREKLWNKLNARSMTQSLFKALILGHITMNEIIEKEVKT